MDAPNEVPRGHWTQDEFLRHLYGLESDGPSLAHLSSCGACQDQWTRLQQRRGDVLAGPSVDEARLREQRHAIWARIEARPARKWTSWRIPAAATALVVLLAVVLSRPAGPAEDPLVEIAELAAPHPVSDTQFFEEIATVASSTQPRAAEAVESLFDGGGN